MSDIELQPRRGPGRPPMNRDEATRHAGLTSSGNAPEVVEHQRKVQRRPFSSVELKLAYEQREGYHRHWFNDTPGRVGRALEAGYEHVKGKDGKNVSRLVGKDEGGSALIAFLMEIPEDWYKEDMAREQSLIDEKESSIKRGITPGAEVEKGYIPSQGISIRR